MERLYHFSIHDQPLGPFDEAAIREHIHNGEITGDTLAWCEGMGDWQPAGQIDELTATFAELRAPAPAKPPPLPGVGGKEPPPLSNRTTQAHEAGESEVPEGLTSLEAAAYRFVLAIYRTWAGHSPPLRTYVVRNPKRALPVAAATLGVMLLILFMLPNFWQTPDQATAEQPPPQAMQPGPTPPANWQQGYNAWRDAHNYSQNIIDDVYDYNKKRQDKMDDIYRQQTLGLGSSDD